MGSLILAELVFPAQKMQHLQRSLDGDNPRGFFGDLGLRLVIQGFRGFAEGRIPCATFNHTVT